MGISAVIALRGAIACRKERRRAVEETLAQGTITLWTAALNDKVVNRFRTVVLLITVIIIILMVTKPVQVRRFLTNREICDTLIINVT
jgi:hypothetical protein